jgi:hypothetical protein
VKFELFNYRHAREILKDREEWREVESATRKIRRAEIIEAHDQIRSRRKQSPVGAQSAINSVFRKRLSNWESEPRLFDSRDRALRGWKMDFYKKRIGIEVSFNHAEAVPWTFTRLNIGGESQEVIDEHRIDVGIAIFAAQSLKAWGKMDASVGTFELACEWLRLMRPIMPIPILVLGLRADGWEPGAFPGPRSGRKGSAAT